MQLSLLLLILAPAAAQQAAPAVLSQARADQLSGRMIVRPQQQEPARAAALQRITPWIIRHYAAPDFFVVAVPEGMTEDSYAAALMATGEFEYAHPDWICSPLGNTPNDPWFGQQWHHRVMLSELAWDVTTGDSSYIASWVDTGVDLTHPDLAASLVPGYNSADKVEQVNGGAVNDINGHGTAVAGCIGAIGNNGVAVAGVNWNVKLMPVRTTNQSNGNAYLSDLLDGALWAVAHGAGSVSVSYTGVEYPAVSTTGDTIHGQGGVLLWAAGNSATDLWWFDWSNVVIVGATNNGDHKTSWSSYGLAVDNVAPGDFITTTALGGGVWSVSGTSFSTPLTNGAVALIWANNPTWSNDEVLDKLFASCDDLGVPGEDNTYGHGRVNLARGVDAPGLPPRLHLDMTAAVAGQSMTFTASNATPGGTVHFFYAPRYGPTPWPDLNVDLGLVNPVEFGTATTNAAGAASLSVFVPPGYRGRRVWAQAAEFEAVSGLVLVWVQ